MNVNEVQKNYPIIKNLWPLTVVVISVVFSPQANAGRSYTHSPIVYVEDIQIFGPGRTFGEAPEHIKSKFFNYCPMGNNTLRHDTVNYSLGVGSGNGNGRPRDSATASACRVVMSDVGAPLEPGGSPGPQSINHFSKVILNNVGNNYQDVEIKAIPVDLENSPFLPGLLYSGFNTVLGSRNMAFTFGCAGGTLAAINKLSFNDPATALTWPSGTRYVGTDYPSVLVRVNPGTSAACLFNNYFMPSGDVGGATGWDQNLKVLGGTVFSINVPNQNLGAVNVVVHHKLEYGYGVPILNENSPAFESHIEHVIGPGRPL
jgi:hypothetical protein